jgi:hypothetical protein
MVASAVTFALAADEYYMGQAFGDLGEMADGAHYMNVAMTGMAVSGMLMFGGLGLQLAGTALVNAGAIAGAYVAETVYVIGRQVDTAEFIGKSGYNVLNDPNWSLDVNEAWVQSAIDSGSPVELATDPGIAAFFTTPGSSPYFGTVYGQEIDQLMEAGYTYETINGQPYLMPPS